MKSPRAAETAEGTVIPTRMETTWARVVQKQQGDEPATRRRARVSSKMEQRLLIAAEWIGKSRRDSDHAKAFAQLVFALEAIIGVEKQNTLVSPSTTYRLAETCAFVVDDDRRSRRETVAEVKRIYEARSRIVHGGATTVPEDLRFRSLVLLARLMERLLTNPELSKMTDADMLSEWVQNRKYA